MTLTDYAPGDRVQIVAGFRVGDTAEVRGLESGPDGEWLIVHLDGYLYNADDECHRLKAYQVRPLARAS